MNLSNRFNSTCFELPIVIVSPTSKSFPSSSCTQAPYPATNCMKEPVEANIEVIDWSNGSLNCLSDERTAVHLSDVHYRGQSSLHFSKHQFGIHFKSGADKFLGFPEEKSFVLNGPFVDGTLLRNHLAHWLFRGTQRYSPRTRHVVVFVSKKPGALLEHQGIYLALEKISYSHNRVGLARLDHTCAKDQLGGGWAWQINPLDYGVYSPNVVMDKYQMGFGSGQRPVLMFPPAENMTQTMRDYFVDPQTGPLPQLYRYLYENMTQPDDLELHLDLGSFVDYWLHSEMSQNTDAYRKSTYFFKDRDHPIEAGPVWDFNLAYGQGANQQDWLYKIHPLWQRLMCNYKFVALIQQRWRELRQGQWSDLSIRTFLNASALPIRRQLEYCAEDWRSAELQCANVKSGGETYDEFVMKLEQTVLLRAQWMDANIGKFYRKLDDPILFVPLGTLPEYNCAADGSDSGCLSDPDKYINSVTFPPIRESFSGEECEALTNELLDTRSIDPCWLSTGTSVTGGWLTPFCSGHGWCDPGPGAKCTCIHDAKPPLCQPRHPWTPPIHQASTSISKGVDRSGLLILCCFGVLLALTVYYKNKVHRRTRRGFEPMQTAPFASVQQQYGST